MPSSRRDSPECSEPRDELSRLSRLGGWLADRSGCIGVALGCITVLLGIAAGLVMLPAMLSRWGQSLFRQAGTSPRPGRTFLLRTSPAAAATAGPKRAVEATP